ncbi:MAG TPA: ABC transporter substrate-binding protein [Longimicrobium sp.]|nr:ABC transporter substrate-binding protein [Longimicrobium sp.]
MSRLTKRAHLLSLALLAALAACGGGGDKGGDGKAAGDTSGLGGTPEDGGTAVLLELGDIGKPMPVVFDTQLDGDLMDVMFMGLTRGAWRDGRLMYLTYPESPMALSKGWELTGPDSAAIRYHMRGDVLWSDGKPVTSRDVVWTYDMVADPRVASPRLDYAEHIDSVTAQDDSTVTFWFDRRYADVLFYSGLPIAPSHVFEGSDPAQIRNHPAVTDPSGGRLPVTGPFLIGTWVRGERVVLARNPKSALKPHLDQIVMRVVPEATTRLIELQTGRADVMRPIPPDQVPALRQQAPFLRFLREEKRNYDYIGYNPRTVEAFRDRRVREALGLAIDVNGIIRALQLEEFATQAGGPYAPIFKDLYDPRRMAPLPYDTTRARQLLDEAGWRDADGDGIREKNGRPLRFTLVTNSGNARRADVSQIVQQQWRKVGVDAQLQQLEGNTMFDRLQKKNFEAVLAGWSVGLSPDLQPLWGPTSPFNFTSYDNQQAFALFSRAQAQPTPEAANQLWKEAAALIVADRPYTWLYYIDGVSGVNERLRGIHIDTYGAYQNSWEWWIPKDRQRAAPAAAQQAAPPAGGAAATDSGAK